jgi:hypothetical protein
VAGHVVIAAQEAVERYVEQLVAQLDDAGIPSWVYYDTGDQAEFEQMEAQVETCAAVVAVMFEQPDAGVAFATGNAFEYGKPIFPLRLGGLLFAWLSRSAHSGRPGLRHAGPRPHRAATTAQHGRSICRRGRGARGVPD